eukprot:1157243-Pelagomonas_calceolata.AAC.8
MSTSTTTTTAATPDVVRCTNKMCPKVLLLKLKLSNVFSPKDKEDHCSVYLYGFWVPVHCRALMGFWLA